MHVLIIEDDEDARINLCDILELDGHRVEAAASADRALAENVDLSQVDVIILDRKLPDGLAEEILPAFRRRAPNAVAIVVTGYANLHSTITAFREGAVDYILKPIDPAALRASLLRIAERRKMELQLQKEREFAENILRTAEAIVVVLDTAGRVMRFNPYLTELTGITLAEAEGKNWIDLFIPPEQQPRVREIFKRAVLQLESRGVINSIQGRQGQRFDIRWSNTTLKDDQGETTAVLSVGLDISDLLRAQEQLLQAERLAAIGRTMTGMAHESRNALQRLQNAVELLELQLEGYPEALRDLAKIERASKDLWRLLEEVRTYAAPIQLEKREVVLASVWRNAWNDLEPRRQRRDVELIEIVSCEHERSQVDHRKLEQVFRNIFENALDACSDPVRIEVLCQSMSRHRCRICVTDNGPGLPAPQHAKVFEAFHTTKPTGTGLGLSIARRIVEAHGGTLTVDSRAARGARFIIELPLKSPETSS